MLKRNFYIDVLRGICVLFVILRHLHIRIPFQELGFFKNLHEWVWKFFFLNGNEGVIVFFVISGFLITSNTLSRYGPLFNISFRKFYRMRFARIAPPLLLLLLILSVFHLYEVKYFVIPTSKAGLGEALFSALTFHLNWLEGQVGYLPGNWDVLWSLSVEEVFYFAFPIICLLTRWRGAILLFFVFVVIAPFYRNYTSANTIWTTKAYLSNMGCISIGCIAALLTYEKNYSKDLSRVLSAIGFIGIILTMGIFRRLIPEELVTYRLDRDLLSVFTAFFLVFCSRIDASKIMKILLYPLERIGKVSYEVYLFHMFFVYWAVDVFKHYKEDMDLAIPILLSTVALSYLLSVLLEKFYSVPLNRILRNASSHKETVESVTGHS